MPKKCTCLNKCVPDFWVSAAITQEPFNIMYKYSRVQGANFIGIRWVEELVLCLHAQRVYLALYGTHSSQCCFSECITHSMKASKHSSRPHLKTVHSYQSRRVFIVCIPRFIDQLNLCWRPSTLNMRCGAPVFYLKHVIVEIWLCVSFIGTGVGHIIGPSD